MIFDRPRYSPWYHPFPASAIIGAGMAGATWGACVLNGTDPGNTFWASLTAGLAVGTAVSIPLVITHQWILLKTLPWYEKPKPIVPEYPRAIYNSEMKNLNVEIKQEFPPITRWKLHRGFQVALKYGRVSARVMREAGYNEDETRLFREWLFHYGYAQPVRGAAELNDAGKGELERLSPIARGYRA